MHEWEQVEWIAAVFDEPWFSSDRDSVGRYRR